MSAGTVARVNSVGADTLSGGSAPPPPKKNGNQKLHNWLIGFGFSWLPLLSKPLIELLHTGKFLQFFLLVISDASVIYIGVSLTVSAMNDLGPKESTRAKLYTLFLAFAATVYSVINLTKNLSPESPVNTTVLIIVNIIFLATPLACGLHQYLRKNGGDNDG